MNFHVQQFVKFYTAVTEDQDAIPLQEGLLQCISWVLIKEYLSKGRVTSRINWLDVIYGKINH